MPLQPADADFAARVRSSFERQAAVRTLGAALADVRAGHGSTAANGKAWSPP
jgi:hypothetical protein